MRKVRSGLLRVISIVIFAFSVAAHADGPKMGIVVMHGKGGSPDRLVNGLADELAKRGYIVANLEMPWSGNRGYDVDTAAADTEIEKAIADMRTKGAKKVFVAGHSQGGAFAIHYAATHRVDGLITIVPGANPDSDFFRNKIYKFVKKAKKLVKAGKGDEKIEFKDFEGRRGLYSIITTPKNYLAWFSPDSAMNYEVAIKRIDKNLPVLFVESKGDYPGLRKYNLGLYDELPRNRLSRLYQPQGSHKKAPEASIEEIAAWTMEVASTRTE